MTNSKKRLQLIIGLACFPPFKSSEKRWGGFFVPPLSTFKIILEEGSFLYIIGGEMLPPHRHLLSKTGIFLNINPMRKEGENDGRNRNRTSLIL